jgi:hypothetical protein
LVRYICCSHGLLLQLLYQAIEDRSHDAVLPGVQMPQHDLTLLCGELKVHHSVRLDRLHVHVSLFLCSKHPVGLQVSDDLRNGV